MNVKIFRSIQEIEPTLWDSIISDNSLYKKHSFLSAIEDSDLSNSRYWYILFFEDSKLVAHTTLFTTYSYIDESMTGKFIKLRYIANKIRIILPFFLRAKIVACGTPIATCSNMLTLDDLEKCKNILIDLDKLIKKISKQEKAHMILYRDFDVFESEKIDILKRLGYIKVHSPPAAFLDIKWESFTNYMSSFKSSFRNEMKRNLKKFEKGDLTLDISSNFSEHADRIYQLYSNVYEKAEFKFEKLTPAFFLI